jgi:hypothetical protein
MVLRACLERGVRGADAGDKPVDIARQQRIVKLFVVRELQAHGFKK